MIKMKQKILLINPRYRRGRNFTLVVNPPISLLYLSSIASDHCIDILDLNSKYRDDQYIESLIQRYDIIGISCMTETLRETLKLCRMAKKYGKITILGGYHPTLMPSVIDDYDCIDIIVRGDGEFTFKKILDGVPKEEIFGISYRENGKVIHNKESALIQDLDTLPLPMNNNLDTKIYQFGNIRLWSLETTRGCPFHCDFCSIRQFNKGKYREKSPERVIYELKQIPDNIQLVHIIDDNFALKRERVKEICRLIREYNFHKKFIFLTQVRVEDMADEELVKELSSSGFRLIFMGIESLLQRSLDALNKQYKSDKTYKALDLMKRHGIMTFGSFILGNIGETMADVRENLQLVDKLNLAVKIFANLAPFPSTPLLERAIKNGWIKEGFKWENWDGIEAFMRTPDLTIDELNQLNEECNKKHFSTLSDSFLLYGAKWMLKNIRYLPKFSWGFKYIPRMIMLSIKRPFSRKTHINGV